MTAGPCPSAPRGSWSIGGARLARAPQAEASPQRPSERRDLTVGGTARWYLLTTPEHPHPVPLVVDLHGSGGGRPVGEATASQFGAKAPPSSPPSPRGPAPPVEWTLINAQVVPNPDISFIKAMLACLSRLDQCVDTLRLYVTGIGGLHDVVCCTMAGPFAAFVLVAGCFYTAQSAHPARTVPIVAFHGTADPIVLFNGGLGQVTIPTARARGRTSNHLRI